MKIINPLKSSLAVLFVLFIGLYSAACLAADQAIISLSVGSPFSPIDGKCDPAYIIKIFENGHVEYNGLYLIKVLGKQEYQIDKITLKALIKRIQQENLMTDDERLTLPFDILTRGPSAVIGIRFRQGNQEVTKIGNLELMSEIIKATKAEQLGADKVKFCSRID